ncbi:hypothetical protein GCK32_009372, partial [Trichostrongylus colubriformis]
IELHDLQSEFLINIGTSNGVKSQRTLRRHCSLEERQKRNVIESMDAGVFDEQDSTSGHPQSSQSSFSAKLRRKSAYVLSENEDERPVLDDKQR